MVRLSSTVLTRGSAAASLSWLHHLVHRTNTGQTLYKRVQVLALRILRGSDLGGSDLEGLDLVFPVRHGSAAPLADSHCQPERRRGKK